MKKIKISIAFMVFLFLVSSLSLGQTQSSGELTKITIAKSESAMGIQIELDKALKYESFPLLNPNRLVIDFPQVVKFSCDPLTEVNDFGVLTIRVAKFKPDVTRVVFNLADKRPSYTFRENERALNVIFWLEEEKEKPAVKKEPERQIEERAVEKKPSGLFEEMTISIGVNSGLYFFHSTDFQNIYGESIVFFGGETTVLVSPSKNNYIGASLGAKYISKSGVNHHSERVELTIIPVSISAFYLRQFKTFSPYIGVGLDYYDYKETFPDAADIPTISSYPWGTHVQVGTYLRLASSLSLKVYFKYYEARAKEGGVEKNLGGNEYGLSLAYHFKI
ncbi:MAG: AMIN domain-containing protein [Candidatus Aminicenantes bacterium]|nr:MAG: AMIN domain-containing protein [Candidatus Aminicenantes bacterium]